MCTQSTCNESELFILHKLKYFEICFVLFFASFNFRYFHNLVIDFHTIANYKYVECIYNYIIPVLLVDLNKNKEKKFYTISLVGINPKSLSFDIMNAFQINFLLFKFVQFPFENSNNNTAL